MENFMVNYSAASRVDGDRDFPGVWGVRSVPWRSRSIQIKGRLLGHRLTAGA